MKLFAFLFVVLAALATFTFVDSASVKQECPADHLLVVNKCIKLSNPDEVLKKKTS